MFDAIYVINLDRSPERWQWMQTAILPAFAAANVIRWPAVDGSSLDARRLAEFRGDGSLAEHLSLFLRRPEREIGCAMSHIGVLREVSVSGYASALILEDDVALAPPLELWPERLRAAFADLPAGWEIWYLYRCLDLRHPTRRLTSRTVRPWMPLGGAAYAVTPAGARKLLNAVLPISLPIDHAYARQAVRPGRVAAYAASPRLIEPGHFASIIRAGLRHDPFLAGGVNRPPEFRARNDVKHLSREERGEYGPGWLVPGLAAAAAVGTLAAARWLARQRIARRQLND